MSIFPGPGQMVFPLNDTTPPFPQKRVTILVRGVNPVPWTAGTPAMTRGQGGKTFPTIAKSGELVNYQEALASIIKKRSSSDAACMWPDGMDLDARYYFWRELTTYQGPKRMVTKHEADATNMQKATEDAMHGVLFTNDKYCRRVCSLSVEQSKQTSPCVIIDVWPLGKSEPALERHEAIALRNQIEALMGEDDIAHVSVR
jgi:Holliday junction resolvase RusA-like endonuclease